MMRVNPECINSVILTVVGLFLFFTCVYPKLQDVNESFEATMASKTEGPLMNQDKGFVMDGVGLKLPATPRPREPLDKIPENYYFLDDGANGRMSIQHNLCSPSCCSEQYPTPFKMKYDPYVCQNKDKFIPSQIMCNNAFQDSGCLCLTKDQAQFMYNRGGNGREWF